MPHAVDFIIVQVSVNIREGVVNRVVIAPTVNRHVVCVLRGRLVNLLKLGTLATAAAAIDLAKDFTPRWLSQPLMRRVDVKVLLDKGLQLLDFAPFLLLVDIILDRLVLLPGVQGHELVLK